MKTGGFSGPGAAAAPDESEDVAASDVATLAALNDALTGNPPLAFLEASSTFCRCFCILYLCIWQGSLPFLSTDLLLL